MPPSVAPPCITAAPPLSPQAEAAGQDGRVLQTHLRGRPAHGAAGEVPGKPPSPPAGAPASGSPLAGEAERGGPLSDPSSALSLLHPLPLDGQPGLQTPHTLRHRGAQA